MIVVNARFQSTAGNIEAMRDAIVAMQTASLAEKGCEDYNFSVEVSDPTAMRITERWTGMEALAAHFQTPHMAAFQAAMGADLPTGVEAHFFEATEIDMPR